jgi:uncharacterized protein YndB with AHSA1/START domain
MERLKITIETLVAAPAEKAWRAWTDPGLIVRWNHASDDWICPRAEIDLRTGGKFVYRMEARDGSFGFDFAGTCDSVEPGRGIVSTLGDGRRTEVVFREEGKCTRVIETFEAEDRNTVEKQRAGWAAILENYRKVVEES